MIDNNQQKFDNNQQFNFGFGFENLEIEKNLPTLKPVARFPPPNKLEIPKTQKPFCSLKKRNCNGRFPQIQVPTGVSQVSWFHDLGLRTFASSHSSMSRGDSVVAAPPLTPMKSCLSDKSHFGLKMGMVGCPMLFFFSWGCFFFWCNTFEFRKETKHVKPKFWWKHPSLLRYLFGAFV